MNGKATKEEIDFFVEKFNERVEWNIDIRKNLDENFLSENYYEIGYIVDDWLYTKKITDENTNFNEAQIYEYDDEGVVVQELQALDTDDYHWVYYHSKVYETEEVYKKKTISNLLEEIKHESKRLTKLIDEAKEQKLKIDNLMNTVIKLNIHNKKQK